MKVKLLNRKGSSEAGSVVEYDRASAEWLIEKGHAEAVKEKGGSETGAPADDEAKPARRGRPRKDES